MGNTHFRTDGKGNWWRTDFPEQCDHQVFMSRGGKCQGKKGHDGPHWCYNGAGWFCQDWQGVKEEHTIGASQTPPGHPRWVSPEEMLGQEHTAFKTTEKVTDADLIKRLEDEEDSLEDLFPEGVWIDRPIDLTEEERKEMENEEEEP